MVLKSFVHFISVRRAMASSNQRIHSRKRVGNNDKSEDSLIQLHHEDVQKEFTSHITVNSVVLAVILIVLLYFNARELMEYFHHKNQAAAEDIAHSETLKVLEDKLHVATHTLRKASAKENLNYMNPDIDWSGCLYEIEPGPPRKHIVPPPVGQISLVCCNTTVGVLNIEVHHAWAPNGADRFMDMVKNGFFSTKVGLFRALKNFLVQFGLAGDPAVHTKYNKLGNLKDDPQWLPAGPPGRVINGVTRYQKGYLSYAGAGANSRGTQLIMTFQDNQYLGGGSPWEVPWGQLQGAASFETLGKICTEYGEKPSQGKIMNQGVKYLEETFPHMDYITKCAVTRENYTIG